MRPPDVRLAVRSSWILYGAGVVMFAVTALALRNPSLETAAVLTAPAVAVGLLLYWIDRTGRGSLLGVYAGELLGVAFIAIGVAVTGGAQSPYAPYYLLAILHIAMFQPRGRVVVGLLLTLIAFVAPVFYDSGAGEFRDIIVVALLPVLATGAVVNAAVTALRSQGAKMAEREAEALRMAESDELTGVGNYRMFWRSLQREIARAQRHGLAFSLLVLDLDGFKAINDRLGHQAGDEALRRVARALLGEIRTEDILCRQGGDEFAVIAVGAGHSEASELGRRLVTSVARTSRPSHGAPVLSASAGAATFGEPERSAEGLAGAADRALRESKQTRWVLKDPAAPPPEDPTAMADVRLSLLGTFARELALADDEREVLEIAAARIGDALDATAVEIWTRRPPTGETVLAARAQVGAATIPKAGQLAEEAAAVNRLVVIPNEAGGELLAVPVSHLGEPRGAVVVRLPGEDIELRRLALALSAQLGRALAAASMRASLDGDDWESLRRLAAVVNGGEGDERVVELATGTGRVLRLAGDRLEAVRVAALLHDVGMLGIPPGLLLRPTALSAAEQEILHEHPLIAERLLRPIPRLATVAEILRHAHERFDGNGYPDGLAGEQIPLEARILHAAIAYTAMTQPRPYRPAMSEQEARTELGLVAGAQLDPVVVESLQAVLDEVLLRRAAEAGGPTGG